jgi:hypothetical protein
MTKTDLLAALAARPTPFLVGDQEILLRPLRYGDRSDLSAWYRAHKEEDAAFLTLKRKIVARALCDASGSLLLSEEEVDTLDPVAVDLIAEEVGRRSGLMDRDEGKAEGPPETPS